MAQYRWSVAIISDFFAKLAVDAWQKQRGVVVIGGLRGREGGGVGGGREGGREG